jgi:multidrug efflux pump subunit AcrA (membrane-fusion protein)
MNAFKKVMWGGIILMLILLIILLVARQNNKNTDTHPADVTAGEDLRKHDADTAQPHEGKRKIKYWVAPMDPAYIRYKPGKSPMGMDLVPVYEDEGEELDEGAIRIDPVTVQNMGVRMTTVSKGPLHTKIRTIGNVTYDEELVEHIHTKVTGWIEKLFVKTTGEKIRKGQEIISIYSPELVATEEEYLQALKYREKVADSGFKDVVKGAETLLEATRKRLLLMDIDPGQIKALEERGEVRRKMILSSPTSGIVIKKHVFEGMKVDPGMELYTIADLSRVWVIASVYEYELPFLKVGQETIMSLPYEPGATYKGRVTFIYPYLSPKTRTVQVRMEFDNPDLKLKPDMYADVVITTEVSDNALLVPSEAVLKTGYRNIVIAYLGDGKFLPKEVELGPEGEGLIQVLSGLRESETIVTSGQFLIDSESNLREAINKMLEAGEPVHTMKDEAPQHTGEHMGHEMKMEEDMEPADMPMNKEQ